MAEQGVRHRVPVLMVGPAGRVAWHSSRERERTEAAEGERDG